MAEHLAVVGEEDDEGVVQDFALFENVEHAADLAVDETDAAVVIGDYLAEFGYGESAEILLPGTGAVLGDAGHLVEAEIGGQFNIVG